MKFASVLILLFASTASGQYPTGYYGYVPIPPVVSPWVDYWTAYAAQSAAQSAQATAVYERQDAMAAIANATNVRNRLLAARPSADVESGNAKLMDAMMLLSSGDAYDANADAWLVHANNACAHYWWTTAVVSFGNAVIGYEDAAPQYELSRGVASEAANLFYAELMR